MAIPAYQVKNGAERQIIALALDNRSPAKDFLIELYKSNPKGFQILDGQMRFLCDVPEIKNRQTFKILDANRKLYEFHPRTGLRLYCFLADNSLVILTNGGKKNTKKEQSRDIARAKTIQDRFLELIEQGAALNIIES